MVDVPDAQRPVFFAGAHDAPQCSEKRNGVRPARDRDQEARLIRDPRSQERVGKRIVTSGRAAHNGRGSRRSKRRYPTEIEQYWCVAGHIVSQEALQRDTEIRRLDAGAEVRICREHGAPIGATAIPVAGEAECTQPS
jgi:hypothetical protein